MCSNDFNITIQSNKPSEKALREFQKTLCRLLKRRNPVKVISPSKEDGSKDTESTPLTQQINTVII